MYIKTRPKKIRTKWPYIVLGPILLLSKLFLDFLLYLFRNAMWKLGEIFEFFLFFFDFLHFSPTNTGQHLFSSNFWTQWKLGRLKAKKNNFGHFTSLAAVSFSIFPPSSDFRPNMSRKSAWHASNCDSIGKPKWKRSNLI